MGDGGEPEATVELEVAEGAGLEAHGGAGPVELVQDGTEHGRAEPLTLTVRNHSHRAEEPMRLRRPMHEDRGIDLLDDREP